MCKEKRCIERLRWLVVCDQMHVDGDTVALRTSSSLRTTEPEFDSWSRRCESIWFSAQTCFHGFSPGTLVFHLHLKTWNSLICIMFVQRAFLESSACTLSMATLLKDV